MLNLFFLPKCTQKRRNGAFKYRSLGFWSHSFRGHGSGRGLAAVEDVPQKFSPHFFGIWRFVGHVDGGCVGRPVGDCHQRSFAGSCKESCEVLFAVPCVINTHTHTHTHTHSSYNNDLANTAWLGELTGFAGGDVVRRQTLVAFPDAVHRDDLHLVRRVRLTADHLVFGRIRFAR